CACLLFFVGLSRCQGFVEPFERFVLQSFGFLGIFGQQSLLTKKQVLVGHGFFIGRIFLNRNVYVLQTFLDQRCLLFVRKRVLLVVDKNPIGGADRVVRNRI